MRELEPGLWHRQAPHPQWEPGQPWPQEVSSYAIDDGVQLLLFDPLSVPQELLAADRKPVVVLTAPWHERDAESLVERLGVAVYAPPPDTAPTSCTRSVSPPSRRGTEAPISSGRASHRHGASRRSRSRRRIDQLIATHDRLAGFDPEHHVVVLPSGKRLHPEGQPVAGRVRCHLPTSPARSQVVAGLRPLLDRPVEHVLPAHGAPTDRAALERALN